ncbi:MAG: hypothetical protein A2161_19215 [Candidatus Schekmanbacteria bacterium RBG_13_48_7]|uniref:Uncharacterized protein n=1 Tax=Candidatus Schekmanbacteria bacterium RBG_13_48_7 TaxID=1817878 RepID=A0A1F7S998_9BACT|nr:MAG: hypothetical protein A2161_19215 [Candidatus Schekmanbacteria bacterium RBG_13_48_7]
MLNLEIKKVIKSWPKISTFVFVPHNDKEYNRLVKLLDDLIDEVGEDENHPLASLMDLLGSLIEKYENEHVSELTDA